MHISKAFFYIAVILIISSYTFILMIWFSHTCKSKNLTKNIRNKPLNLYENVYDHKGKKLSSQIQKEKDFSCLRAAYGDLNMKKFIDIFYNKEPELAFTPECRDILLDFSSVYEVSYRQSSSIRLPKPFEEKLKSKFSGSMFGSIYNQPLIHVYNRLTYESSVYNPLRSNRPKPSASENIWKYVDKISKETKQNCDMCNYLEQTAVDELGRHETDTTVRVSNAFKIEKWHGMIILKGKHHPTNLTAGEIQSLFEDAVSWATEVEVIDHSYIYPSIAWDTLYKAGASQIHPHVQVTVSPHHYFGEAEHVRSVAQAFYENTNENYFTKLIEIHAAFGLTVWYGTSVALSTVVGKGDMEVLLISEAPSSDLFKLLYFVMKAYHSTNMACHSVSMSWGPIGNSKMARVGQLPAVIRMMPRGNCLSNQNDYSSFELFLTNYRDHDPWEVIRLIKDAIRKYS